MKPFVVNRYGRMVLPFNFFPELDFSAFDSLDQFATVMRRDFEEKAATESEIVARVQANGYATRYELLRDLAVDLFWANRYPFTMYEKRPMRWREVPRTRDDVFLPLLSGWEGFEPAAIVDAGYRMLKPTWDEGTENKIARTLLDIFRHKKSEGAEVPALKPTVGEILQKGANLTYLLASYDPDYPGYALDDIIEYAHSVPELEALMRQTMVLHNQYRWDLSQTRAVEVGKLRDDDWVLAFVPKSQDVLQFIRRVKGVRRMRPVRPAPRTAVPPVKPYPPVEVRSRFRVMPKLESLAIYKGERVCTNEDLIRNAAWCWSPMTALEIEQKTGIRERRYSDLDLDHMALLATEAALAKAGRRPEEIGAVLFMSCTSTKMMPSLATWLSGHLGMLQTHASCDMVAACAGLPYGMAEVVRLLQEVERPVLLVCGEKFSDKIGTVRTSRMIFSDGAAAMVVAPAPASAAPDIELYQTYASGPMAEVDSIIWPNRDFDNNLTVYGPEVRNLVSRYLTQMLAELRAQAHPDGSDGRSMLDAVDLIVPHQANKTMVQHYAHKAGIPADRLYFDIEMVGNTSSASIPIAIHDAVSDGAISRPMRIFAPGFGAGAVAGYVVMRVDPSIVSS